VELDGIIFVATRRALGEKVAVQFTKLTKLRIYQRALADAEVQRLNQEK
jgi:hypothetical protein